MKQLVIAALIGCLSIIGCKQEVPVVQDTVLDIRLDRDPERINPIIFPKPTARQVFGAIFTPMADYHPQTLELIPILITDIPVKKINLDGSVDFEIKFRPEAVWPDGSPITAYDYLFTLKAIAHPMVNAPAYRSYTTNISKVVVDQTDPKKMTVSLDEDYLVATETVVTLELYPAYHYDRLGRLDQVTLEQLMDPSYEDTIRADTALVAFAADINGLAYSTTQVVGAGPYAVEAYLPNKQVVLRAIRDYWGESFKDIPHLQADAEQIVYHIIPDLTNAVTLLKEGEIDIINDLTGAVYEELQASTYASERLDYHVSTIPKIYYLLLNTAAPELADAAVRTALTHLIDKQTIIDVLEAGDATLINTHILPDSRYYNKELPHPVYDLGLVTQLLDEAGWIDTDGDGVRDKVIDGERLPLKLKIGATPGKLSADIAQIIKSDADRVGVQLELIGKQYSVFNQEHVKTKDFHVAPLLFNQDLAPYDPYQRYHSDNRYKGSNYSGYSDIELDSIILKIRKGGDYGYLKPLYDRFQEIIYRDNPIIYLYSPKNRIAVDKAWQLETTIKRPGYMANDVTPR